jgi:hypothetical protein
VSEPNETLFVHEHRVGNLVSAVVIGQRLHPQVGSGVVLPRPSRRTPSGGVGRVPRTPVEVATFEFVPRPLVLVIVVHRLAVDVAILVATAENVVLIVVVVVFHFVLGFGVVLGRIVRFPRRVSLVSRRIVGPSLEMTGIRLDEVVQTRLIHVLSRIETVGTPIGALEPVEVAVAFRIAVVPFQSRLLIERVVLERVLQKVRPLDRLSRNVIHDHLVPTVVQSVGIGIAIVGVNVVGTRVAGGTRKQRKTPSCLFFSLRHLQAHHDGQQRDYGDLQEPDRQLETPQDPMVFSFAVEAIDLNEEQRVQLHGNPRE